MNGDPEIQNDLPNEDGIPNHSPDGQQVDNHHFITGSKPDGTLYSNNATCSDWTSTTASGSPRCGFSWPMQNRTNWISGISEAGCAAGINIGNSFGGGGTRSIGSGGGYGGFYCFALNP
jgi:hypothetical protein